MSFSLTQLPWSQCPSSLWVMIFYTPEISVQQEAATPVLYSFFLSLAPFSWKGWGSVYWERWRSVCCTGNGSVPAVANCMQALGWVKWVGFGRVRGSSQPLCPRLHIVSAGALTLPEPCYSPARAGVPAPVWQASCMCLAQEAHALLWLPAHHCSLPRLAPGS